MASLYWNWNKYTLPTAAEDIGEVYQAVSQALSELGYTGVEHGEAVSGYKGHYILAVLYLYIGGRNFWQIVACGGNGGSEAEALAEINKVIQKIDAFAFL
jgi:hypothetical protein